MAVLIEATSIIIRVQAIHDRYSGGWESFVQKIPNQTFCSDNELARIGFMTPDDCKSFVDDLECHRIIFLKDGRSQDVIVADQLRGFTVPCDWADFGQVELKRGQTVSAAQLRGTTRRQVFFPEGWIYEGSLSQKFGFVPTETEQKSLRFLRHEQGLDVYLNLMTGKEVYVGRTGMRSS
jgi:hypothetical protein